MATVNLYAERSPHVSGGMRVVTGTYTGPNPYATGGDALGPGDIGLGDIEWIEFLIAPVSGVGGVQSLIYDHTTGKVLWYDNTGAQIAAAVNLSTSVARFFAIGK